jgi:hypothetical protein
MELSTVNLVLDIVLVAASIWMVIVVRGIGGIVGRSLTLIVGGAIVLGVAHLVATFAGPDQLRIFTDGATNQFVHRLIVLAGFVLLVFGFRQIRAMND